MKGYVHNIEKVAQQNKTFRTVLYTAKNYQLVVMSLKPGEDSPQARSVLPGRGRRRQGSA